jgi:hypothetical protein
MQQDQALIERLVTEFIVGYMSYFSGDYFVETYTDSDTRVEVIRQVTQAAFTNAYALTRMYQCGASTTEVVAEASRKGWEYVPTIGG